MKKKLIISFAAISLVVAVVAALFVYRVYYDRRVPNFEGNTEIYIYPDTSCEEALSMILQKCKVKNEKSITRVFRTISELEPGHYTIGAGNSSMYVARMLSAGWQTPVNLVLSGTMRSEDVIARKVSNQMMIDSLSALSVLNDEAILDSIGIEKEFLYAYIIPDTYQVYWTESMVEVLERLKKEYDAFWSSENLAKAEALGLDKKEVSILASIVSSETNHVAEMPAVAAVYLNRLRIGMKLQADPTVAYCFDYKLTRVLNKHLEVDSPFNTYKHAGLPPAPICVPSKSALLAALNPDKHSFLYFCASPEFDGTHLFATSYSEHLRNARAFQSALTQRQRSGK